MPPFSIHAALGKYELAIAFGKSETTPEPEPESESVAELMPVLSESDRDLFGFRRLDRPEAF